MVIPAVEWLRGTAKDRILCVMEVVGEVKGDLSAIRLNYKVITTGNLMKLNLLATFQQDTIFQQERK